MAAYGGVDTLGLVLICICTSANSAYRGVGIDLKVGVNVEASERKEGQKGFVPEAFRWAVERTFAWLNRQRRLVRNYEKKVRHQESMNYIGNARIYLKRYQKWLAD